MRLYVGTLYTVENEFDDCVESIKGQSYHAFEHVIFKGLPNNQAHKTLFRSFLARAAEFDVLVKVDADMVLARDTLFAGIVRKLEANRWARVLSIAVHDFFSNELIWGLNAYRNTVTWEFSKETLFVDRPQVPESAYLFDKADLAPAAYHCKAPSSFQAFHYGIHHGLKALQPRGFEQNEQSGRTHWRAMDRTWQHFLETGDARLGLACIGAELAYRGTFSPHDLDYASLKARQAAEKYAVMAPARLRRELRLRRLQNFAFIPGARRRRVLRVLYA